MKKVRSYELSRKLQSTEKVFNAAKMFPLWETAEKTRIFVAAERQALLCHCLRQSFALLLQNHFSAVSFWWESLTMTKKWIFQQSPSCGI
jgi:hypothetical protein